MAPNFRVSKPVDAEAWPSLGAAPARQAPSKWGPKTQAATGKPSPAPDSVQLSVEDLKAQASPVPSTIAPSTTSPPPSEPGSDLQEQDEAKDGSRTALAAVVKLGEYNGIPIFGAPQFGIEVQPKGQASPAAPPGVFAAAAVPPGLAGEPRRTSLKDVLPKAKAAEIKLVKLVKPMDVVPKPPPPGLDAKPAGAPQRTPLRVLNGTPLKAPGQRTGLRTGAPLFVPCG